MISLPPERPQKLMQSTSYLANQRRKKKQSRLQRRLRYLYLRLIRLRSTTPAIARGIAMGVFAGLFPLFGLQTVIGLILALIVRGNKITAAIGTWISNPFTYVPIYIFNYNVGRFLLKTEQVSQDIDWTSTTELLQAGKVFAITLFVGCTVVGAIAALISYFLALWLIPRLKQRSKS